MPFKRLTPSLYPPRQWAILGDPGSGKSTFASQMAGPILVVDADHRFQEVARLAQSEVFTVETVGNEAEAIAAELRANMEGSGIRTIVVDSLTAIVSPLITRAVMDNDAGVNRNKVAAFKAKALAVRLLQDAITAWGTDTLWIYHTRQGRDAGARLVESTSISAAELARLRRSLNMTLHVEAHHGRHLVTVEWARRGRYPITLEDESGCWRSMPERIEAAVYDGLSEAEQEAIKSATPTSFHSKEEAIAWMWESGVCRDAQHAANLYDKLKKENDPQTAPEMWKIVIAEIVRRKAEAGQETVAQEEAV